MKFNQTFWFLFFLLILTSFIKACGTIYVPQILPEGRGIAKSEGQEIIKVEVIPLTNRAIKIANEDDYIRRVIDAGDLKTAARLISVDQAINEKLPQKNDPGPYKLGIGDVLSISQLLSVEDETGFSQKIANRNLSIADDGYASVLGIGRVPLAGLTQFEAEDLIYERLVIGQVNPEFELFISNFNSKKIIITNNFMSSSSNKDFEQISSNIFQIPFTNYPIFLNEILSTAKVRLPEGQDALISLKRGPDQFRMSLRNTIEGKQKKIRLFPEDQIIIDPLPYRPETVVITGEVLNPRLYDLSPSDRKTLSEALYSDETFDQISSDTSQIYLLRPKKKNKLIAYHLDASNPSRLILANKIELRPGDIIYVAPQPITNYNRALTQIFGAYAITIDPKSAVNE